MKITSSTIDGKICVTKSGSSNTENYGVYAAETHVQTGTKGEVAVCGEKGASDRGGTSPQFLKEFVRDTLVDGSKNWPTSKNNTASTVKSKLNDNAIAMAGDLTKLTPDEKTKVAGLLAKTIEGGEVVEIRAVSSTSVMVNSSGYTKLRHMM
ncbi:hypothetical protein ANAPC5_00500 [Anaplasma phagocytophilum]|nr:hypothetical protein [Anaplasma phagocytophilum]SBO31265.1 hypothetical protein ANAPC4_00438 [Anaplasma phagocytophilum]SBO31445.1 hypothetical protein ANAPC2_00659 [Anaplasma phagocytophilum]SBO31516.1 hypothetical protein ANAPC3_00557 [Anaplasma phagocytophilum]SCV63224.1 hypothetical protein ANAPC5_00500 [Anaplasma phagocytophilum]